LTARDQHANDFLLGAMLLDGCVQARAVVRVVAVGRVHFPVLVRLGGQEPSLLDRTVV
jgi:hypothetical protein